MVEKVLFLDIDGVLQPGDARNRFKHINEMDKLYEELFAKYGIDYSAYSKYDDTAVYYDWDKESLQEFRRILDTTGAKIVISSDWRHKKQLSCLQDFFRIHDMADYVIDFTPDLDNETCHKLRETAEYKDIRQYRCIEILEYVKAHPEVKKWVAIDDVPLDRSLKDNAVVTSICNKLLKDYADKCIERLGVVK
jgi:hypothetical protein